MGWTSYNVPTIYRKGKHIVDRKAECDKLFNQDMITWDDECKVIGKFEVLKSSMSGSTYYAAVRRTKFATETEPENSIVFAAIVLTSVDNKSYYNFSYKDMDETVGPYQYDCPKAILDLLTPTDSEWANEWRKKCYENLKAKRDPNTLSNLPIGSEIKFTLNDGEEYVAFKHSPAYQFKRPFWMLMNADGYIKTKNIPDNYEVIKRGSC